MVRAEILFVTDQLPYPPRNGVTLPTYHYLLGLKDLYKISVCLFYDISLGIDEELLKKNEQLFGKFLLIPVKKSSKIKCLWNELSLKELYFYGWKTTAEIELFQVDSVIVSPMSAVGKWYSSGFKKQVSARLKIAATNDCTTAEFRLRKMHVGGGLMFKLKALLDWLRSFVIARVEKRYLYDFDHVLLQTNTDKNLINQYVSSEISKKVEVVSNGVNSDLFQLSKSPKNRVLFIAELSGEYALIAKWLVEEVWPKVHEKLLGYELYVVGKGASDSLKFSMASDDSITHIEFVDNLSLLYAEIDIAISPVFKGFGLINKTLEAMASGIPVVGGLAAFNGIQNFQPEKDALVCHTPNISDFVNALVLLGENEELRVAIGQSGQVLIKNQFSWPMAVNKINKLISL